MTQLPSFGTLAAVSFVFLTVAAPLPCVVQAETVEPEKIEKSLEQATQADQFEAALTQCLAGIEADSEQAEYYRLQAQALRALGRIDEIPEAIGSAIEMHPRNVDLLLQRAIAWKQLDRIDEMKQDCERLTRLGNGLGFQLQAQAAKANGERLKTIFFYTRLLETFPGASEAAEWKLERATALVALNVLDWASSDLRASIEVSDGPLKQLLMGELHARAKRWEMAEASLANFKSMNNEHYVGEVRRLNVLMDMAEFKKVAIFLEEYEQKYQGTDQLVHVAEIRSAFDKRMSLKAEMEQAALENHRPSGSETYEELAAEQDRLKELIASSDPSLALELKELTLRRGQHAMYQNEPDYVGSMLDILSSNQARFSRAGVMFTSTETAQRDTLLAWSQLKSNEYGEAEATIKKAIASDDQLGDAHRVAASIYYLTNQFEPALVAANQAVQIDPMNSINVGYRGLIQCDIGNFREALADINEANRLAPDNDWVTQLLQRVSEKIGVVEAAILYQGQSLTGDYTDHLLERCELFLAGGLAQFALLDAMEYAKSVEEADTAAVNGIIARAASLWYEQTLQFDNGGPTTEQFVNACRQAQASSPENTLFAFLLSEALRYQGEDGLAIDAAERTVELGGVFPIVLHQLASLYLHVGAFESARAANERLQAIDAQDEQSKSLQKDMASIMMLAEDLKTTLENADFQTETGTAVGKMLAGPEATRRVFDERFATRLDGVYRDLRKQIATVEPAGAERRLQLGWVRSSDLLSQDPTTFDFDEQLASLAGRLRSDQAIFFNAKFFTPGTVSGPTFGYFLRTDQGWRLLPKPWLAE